MNRILMTAGLVSLFGLLCACGMPDPDTPLTRASLQGNVAEVESLLSRGADPNDADSHGLTPLVLAARLGRVEVARALLTGGADPDRFDSLHTRPGWTPLMNAVHKRQGKIVKVLLEAGAHVDIGSSDGNSALALASVENDPDIVTMLLAAGADPHVGAHGSSALTGAVAACRTENVKALLEAASDLKLEEGLRGSSAVWLAKLRGHGEILRMIDVAHGRVQAPGPGRS